MDKKPGLPNPFGLSLSKPVLPLYAPEGQPFDKLRANGIMHV